MRIVRRPVLGSQHCSSQCRDRGAVDISIQMLFGLVAVLFALLLIFETVAYWHARNVFDEAAAEGARVAAALDGTCARGVAAAHAMVRAVGGSWADDVTVSCVDGPIVAVTVAGRTPGVLGDGLGFQARVTETAPKER